MEEKRGQLAPVLLEFPVAVIEGANLACFQPPRDTMKMKGVVAHSPSYVTLLG
jgi:hypothetical protein